MDLKNYGVDEDGDYIGKITKSEDEFSSFENH